LPLQSYNTSISFRFHQHCAFVCAFYRKSVPLSENCPLSRPLRKLVQRVFSKTAHYCLWEIQACLTRLGTSVGCTASGTSRPDPFGRLPLPFGPPSHRHLQRMIHRCEIILSYCERSVPCGLPMGLVHFFSTDGYNGDIPLPYVS